MYCVWFQCVMITLPPQNAYLNVLARMRIEIWFQHNRISISIQLIIISDKSQTHYYILVDTCENNALRKPIRLQQTQSTLVKQQTVQRTTFIYGVLFFAFKFKLYNMKKKYDSVFSVAIIYAYFFLSPNWKSTKTKNMLSSKWHGMACSTQS